MSLLEQIIQASSDQCVAESNYPITLNPDTLFLKPKPDDPDWNTMLKPGEPFPISQPDSTVIELNNALFVRLKKKLKNASAFTKDEFWKMLDKHLKKVGEVLGVSVVGFAQGGERLRVLLGRDLKGLVLEGCIALEDFGSLEMLISNGVVEYSSLGTLISNLIEKRRSDLLVLCLKNLSSIPIYDLMCVLKYFLAASNNGIVSMGSVRKEWESQALLCVEKVNDIETKRKKEKDIESKRKKEKVNDKGGKPKNDSLAKGAALWIMMAYDGFSVSELCLHHFLASKNLDEVILAACISKLDGAEIMSLVKYLGKWLKKYERFPQAGSCPNAASVLGFKVCDWIPTQEVIFKCLGLVVDEHFSLLVLHKEFHEELTSLESVVISIAAEAKLCGSIANLTNILKSRRSESLLEKLQSSFLLYGDGGQ